MPFLLSPGISGGLAGACRTELLDADSSIRPERQGTREQGYEKASEKSEGVKEVRGVKEVEVKERPDSG
jgi:hypothetical protein